MSGRIWLAILIVPSVVIATIGIGALLLLTNLSGEASEPIVGLTAEAVLESPDGDFLGTVKFRQVASGVLIMADVKGLPPGGHAFIIHETGACTPDFNAAGDHFNPTETEHGFVHSGWKRGGSVAAHGGDLPNIYAASDGSARADFFTSGFTLTPNQSIAIFDADGAAIIIHERPDAYGETESETGKRLACGVIK